MRHVLVCGGRNFDDYDKMKEALDEHGPYKTLINGAMKGADALSSYYAYERKIDTFCIGPMWGLYGNAAGPRRNEKLLEFLLDVAKGRVDDTLVVAFLEQNKTLGAHRGTSHMVRIASAKNVPVLVVG